MSEQPGIYICEKCDGAGCADCNKGIDEKSETIARLQERIKELEAQLEKFKWKDIADAPTDGSHILLYRPEIIFAGYWAKAGWIIKAQGLPVMDPPPTRWAYEPVGPQEGDNK